MVMALAAARDAVSEYRRFILGASRNVRLFLLGTATYGLRQGIVFVVLPLYGHAVGWGPETIGGLTSGLWLTLLLFSLPLGVVSDRHGRRLFLVGGSVISAAGWIALPLAPSAEWALAISVIAGFSGTTFWTCGDPFLVENCRPEDRVRVFASKWFLSAIASALGQVLGGVIPELLAVVLQSSSRAVEPLRGALLLTGPIEILAAGAFLLIGRQDRTASHARAAGPSRGIGADLPYLLALLMPELGVAVANSMYNPFLSLYFRVKFGLNPGPIGTLISIAGLARATGSLASPMVARAIGTIATVSGGRAMAAPLLGIIAFSPWLPLTAVALVGQFACTGMANPPYMSYAMSSVASNRRATFSALYSVLWSLGLVAGPTISGRIQAVYGFETALGVSIVGYLFSGLWAFIVLPRLVQPRETAQVQTT
ncbi:MAG: MFS transporter [Chloroflexi bacterium]|nr:MFS transporter [Chloroflexota bacterium]